MILISYFGESSFIHSSMQERMTTDTGSVHGLSVIERYLSHIHPETMPTDTV